MHLTWFEMTCYVRQLYIRSSNCQRINFFTINCIGSATNSHSLLFGLLLSNLSSLNPFKTVSNNKTIFSHFNRQPHATLRSIYIYYSFRYFSDPIVLQQKIIIFHQTQFRLLEYLTFFGKSAEYSNSNQNWLWFI